jgi:hypothetical protein
MKQSILTFIPHLGVRGENKGWRGTLTFPNISDFTGEKALDPRTSATD